jgi:hypothetical protein
MLPILWSAGVNFSVLLAISIVPLEMTFAVIVAMKNSDAVRRS